MKKVLLFLTVAVSSVGVAMPAAHAMAPFKKEFDEKYVKKDSTDPTEKSFAAAVEKVKCMVCHAKKPDGKQDTKSRNDYGKQFESLLKKTDVKDKKKIQEALDKVALMHSDPNDPSSPTYGELIKQGKLPGGDQ